MKETKIKSSFNKFTKSAAHLLKNKKNTLATLKEGINKATKNKEQLNSIWDKLQLFFSLGKDYANGNYKDVSPVAIAAVIGSLLYFLSPIDVIPDFILGLGFLDDAFIIGYVFNKVSKELDKYANWKKNQQHIIHI